MPSWRHTENGEDWRAFRGRAAGEAGGTAVMWRRGRDSEGERRDQKRKKESDRT